MLGTMTQGTAHDAPAANRFARSGTALLVGALTSNLLSYAFFVILSRYLSEGELGAVGSMVNLSVIATVPALGLQLVAARLVARRAHEPARVHPLERRLLGAGLALGVAVALVLALVSPAVARFLHVDVVTVIALAAALLPLTLAFTVQGLLQGRERFTALAVVLALSGVAKLVGAILAARLASGVTGVTVLYAAATAVVGVAGAAWVLATGGGLPASGEATRLHGTARLARLVAAAIVPTSGLLFLASIDVLLARQHLSRDESGLYTMGSLFEKAGFWGMSFLATLFYPAMTHADRRRKALLRALGVTAGIGALGTLATALLGGPLVAIVGGPGFAELSSDVWRFTAYGVALALVQVLAYAGVAAATVRMGLAMWVVAGLGVVWVSLAGRSVQGVVTILLTCALALVAAGLVVERRTLGASRDAAGVPLR